MELDCAVITDLLPLYQEGLASEASRRLVEAHLPHCPSCRAELETLESAASGPQTVARPLIAVGRSIKKRRWLAIGLAACLILALAASFLAYATAWQELPWDANDFTFTRKGDQLVIGIRRAHANVSLTGSAYPDDSGLMVYYLLTQSVPRFDPFRRGGQGHVPSQITLDLPEGREPSIYYVKTGEPAVHVYGPDLFADGGFMTLPRLALSFYALAAGAAALFLAALLLVFYRKPRARRALKALLGLPLAYLGGHLLVKGFYTLSHDSLLRDFLWILACAAFLYIAWLAFWALRRHPGQGRLP